MFYKLVKDRFGNIDSIKHITETGEHMSIPMNPESFQYQEYLKWVEKGNTPIPADDYPS